jgi:hypothetical protein
MYCEDSKGVHIDHFWPLSRFPRRAFRWTNYLRACSYCDSHKKGDKFPLAPIVNRPLLIKPTKDDPLDHLRLTPSTGRFKPRRKSRMVRRRSVSSDSTLAPSSRRGVATLGSSSSPILIDYAEQRRRGRDDVALVLEASLRSQSFSCVFVYLLDVASGSGAALLRPECLAAIHAYPEIRSWLGRRR